MSIITLKGTYHLGNCFDYVTLPLQLLFYFIHKFVFPTEHRNMPLDDAMPFLSRNFDNFVELMKQKISQANEWLTPDSKVAFYLNLLAEGRRVTLPEIIEVDKYVQAVIGKLRPAAERPAARPPVASVSREVIGEPRYPPESRGLLGMGQRAAPTQPRQGKQLTGRNKMHTVTFMMDGRLEARYY